MNPEPASKPFEKDTDHLMSNLPKVGYIYLTITPLDRPIRLLTIRNSCVQLAAALAAEGAKQKPGTGREAELWPRRTDQSSEKGKKI